MRRLLRAGTVTFGLAAAACAAAEWRHPSLPEDRWRADIVDCRRKAAIKVEDEVARAEHYGAGGPGRGRDDGAATARDAMMARFEAEKREKSLFEQCLTARGYVKVKAAGG